MGWRLTPLYAGLRFQEYCHEGWVLVDTGRGLS